MKTELEKKEIHRLSNNEANKITRECLQIALMKLMSLKSFDSITITEITRKAGVSRTAFYRNYNSKEEIIEDAIDSLSVRLQESFEHFRSDWKGWFLLFFKTVGENKESVRYALQANVHIGPTDFLNTAFPPADREEFYTHVAKEAAFYRILSEWFTGGMKESPEEMADFCEKILGIE